mmetsp:Transcript_11394/g.20006  ORF Transcript_11394/g.20006 Transcript_11394/m.20006 type:complete len:98 (-) Transcript_11394:849-1142(-)
MMVPTALPQTPELLLNSLAWPDAEPHCLIQQCCGPLEQTKWYHKKKQEFKDFVCQPNWNEPEHWEKTQAGTIWPHSMCSVRMTVLSCCQMLPGCQAV